MDIVESKLDLPTQLRWRREQGPKDDVERNVAVRSSKTQSGNEFNVNGATA